MQSFPFCLIMVGLTLLCLRDMLSSLCALCTVVSYLLCRYLIVFFRHLFREYTEYSHRILLEIKRLDFDRCVSGQHDKSGSL